MWQISRSGRIDDLYVFRFIGTQYVPMGHLTFEGTGRQRLGRFIYGRTYLERAKGQASPQAMLAVDPVGLPLISRSFAFPTEEVPLAIHDVGPDGWGKGILDQAFPQRTLTMPEYLALGGMDRTGDLAFGPTPEAPQTWVPPEAPLMELPSDEDDLEALMQAAEAVDQGNTEGHHLKLLVRNSADLGGARPKARLRSGNQGWIAKFHAWGDRFNEPRVEAACLDVAEAAGVPTPERQIVTIGGKDALLVKRFDRSEEQNPYSYLSAGTLLNVSPSEYSTNKTYLDIAVVARKIGVKDAEKQIFKRLLLNSLLHNTDDHLRNHAFIRHDASWELAPAFDIVTHHLRKRHVCAPAPGISPEWSPTMAFEAYTKFGISRSDASTIHEEVVEAARQLTQFMDFRGVSEKDRAVLADAYAPELNFMPSKSYGTRTH